MATIAKRIYELRKSEGLSQAEFGALFGIVNSTVCLYENGRSTPNDQIKTAICKHFGVSMDYLLGLTDEPEGARPSGQYITKEVFGQRLLELREAAGMSARELSEKVGITLSNYLSYEKGKAMPPMDTIVSLCRVLDVITDYLLDERVQSAVNQSLSLDDLEIYLLNLLRKMKKESTPDSESELIELVEDFTSLSPDNRAKLLELCRLYLSAQGNSVENE